MIKIEDRKHYIAIEGGVDKLYKIDRTIVSRDCNAAGIKKESINRKHHIHKSDLFVLSEYRQKKKTKTGVIPDLSQYQEYAPKPDNSNLLNSVQSPLEGEMVTDESTSNSNLPDEVQVSDGETLLEIKEEQPNTVDNSGATPAQSNGASLELAVPPESKVEQAATPIRENEYQNINIFSRTKVAYHGASPKVAEVLVSEHQLMTELLENPEKLLPEDQERVAKSLQEETDKQIEIVKKYDPNKLTSLAKDYLANPNRPKSLFGDINLSWES